MSAIRFTRRVLLSSLAAGPAAPLRKPNIIFILADDLGVGDLGCYGQQKISTPHIDRLATEGMLFTQAYAGAAVCAPSRCCLMTGLHTGHARVRSNSGPTDRVPLAAADLTVAEVLKRAGYRTGIIGKWGLGEAGTAGVPNAQGFDEWYGFLNQDHALEYYPTHLWENHRERFPNGNQGAKRREYVQDLFTNKALDFLARAKGGPFFLYLAYTVPHASSELGRDTGDGFVVPDYGRYENQAWPQPEKGFARMVDMLDRDVGRLLAKLKELGLDENTLVIFASDNGPAIDGGHTPEFFRSALNLRGHKGDLYEGGLRVPLLARWPGRVKPGSQCTQPVAFWDFLPTACHLAGSAAPQGLDGTSLVDALDGKPLAKRAYLYWESPGKRGLAQAVRVGRWKAVVTGGQLALYDLAADPAESRDLAAAEPAVVGQMRAILARARTPSLWDH